MLIAFRDLKDTENEYRQLHKWCSNKFVYEWFEQIDEYLGKDTLGNPEVITVLEKKI